MSNRQICLRGVSVDRQYRASALLHDALGDGSAKSVGWTAIRADVDDDEIRRSCQSEIEDLLRQTTSRSSLQFAAAGQLRRRPLVQADQLLNARLQLLVFKAVDEEDRCLVVVGESAGLP